MKTYREVTRDKGVARTVYASDSWASYIITSAIAHDLYSAYVERWGRQPSRQWFRRNGIHFEELK